ncbi:MAG: excinuclease ABC subunit UvrC [Candidatus Thorarchaeota archaeon]|nr:MAG: excinuclease ABC subunit UvrC [Candidatus Thorarchaeota archaeon]
MTNLAKLVDDLPDSPGVYIWKNEKDEALYIGKAKSLKKRVSSYLRKKGQFRTTWEMMSEAKDLEVILTGSEREALLLEATLIKTRQPRYNIRLKDDKVQTWVRVDLRRNIPSFEVTRDVDRDGATYYGPFGGSRRMERVMDTVRRHIPVCMCKEPENVKRECMDFHLGRCVAPCINKVSKEDYRSLVDQMGLYLDGRFEKLTELLSEQMNDASVNLEFERAATLRDRLDDIRMILRKQKVVEFNGANRDVLGISRTEQAALVELLIIRGGRLIGHDNFYFEVDLETPDSEVLKAFTEQYYLTIPRLPDEVIVPSQFPDMRKLGKWLSETHNTSISLVLPYDEKKQDLVIMANENARRALRKILILEDQDTAIIHDGVKELREALGMDHAPLHIEGFDISNVQGTDPAGSCVVFRNGVPDNKSYRMFRIRVKESPDDYAMMNEVVFRRYRGVLERGGNLPDLVVVDGGKGQLGVALKALEELGLDTVQVAAIAKQDEVLFTREDSDGVLLEFGSDALHLIQSVRDEAHRFAQRYHHKLREKRFSGSILEEAPGIGKKRRAALIKKFGSYKGVRSASVKEIASVEGMTLSAAKKLHEWMETEGN